MPGLVYSVASGAVIYGGQAAPTLPAWVPAAGTFVDLGTATLNAARPSGWPSGDGAGPALNYSGGTFSKSYSTWGAYTLYGSGHLSNPSDPLFCGVWNFNLDTLAWEGTNVPPQPLLDTGSQYNQYGESILAPTLGHTATPHTYGGTVYQPAVSGGGPKGSTWHFFYPGDGNKVNTVHKFDLSSATAPGVRVRDVLPMSGTFASYPAAAADIIRGGVWVGTFDGVGSIKFIKFSDGSYVDHNVGYSTSSNNMLVYIPAPYDCLVGMGQFPVTPGTGEYDANTQGDKALTMGIHVCPIVGDIAQGFTRVNTTGPLPSEGRCGGSWSTILSCIVSYESHGSYDVHKLTPPSPANLTSGTWVWSKVTLTGAGGAVPVTPGYNTNAQADWVENGAFGKFIECAKARCFIYSGSIEKPVQAWRLPGM